MTMNLFLINLALNTLTMAIPVGFAVYMAVRMANKSMAERMTEVFFMLKKKEESSIK